MDMIEQTLQKLGKVGIAQSASDFPDTSTSRKHYRVHHDAKLKEYTLVFWYGDDLTVNFQHSGRHSYHFDQVAYVAGQQAYLFIHSKLSAKDSSYWEIKLHSGIDELTIDSCETDEALVHNLNEFVTSPEAIVLWEREIRRLDIRVEELMVVLEEFGKQWVTNGTKDQATRHKRHYSTRFDVNSSLHNILLWEGKEGRYPWDADWNEHRWIEEFHQKNILGDHAFIGISVWGFSGYDIDGYLVHAEEVHIQAQSIPELMDMIWSQLDDLTEAKDNS